jgi:hypothetical protein
MTIWKICGMKRSCPIEFFYGLWGYWHCGHSWPIPIELVSGNFPPGTVEKCKKKKKSHSRYSVFRQRFETSISRTMSRALPLRQPAQYLLLRTYVWSKNKVALVNKHQVTGAYIWRGCRGPRVLKIVTSYQWVSSILGKEPPPPSGQGLKVILMTFGTRCWSSPAKNWAATIQCFYFVADTARPHKEINIFCHSCSRKITHDTDFC